MVNKAALGVIGVIVVATLGVGLLVGTVMDDGPTDDGPTDDNDDDNGAAEPTATATANQTNGTVTPNATATAAGTRTAMLPRRFESAAIAENVTRLINEERAAQGVGALEFDGETADTLEEMATDHSLDMANTGVVGHNVTGSNVSQRYRSYELFETCKYTDGPNVYRPDNIDLFETIGTGQVGQFYDTGEGDVFVENETQAAQVIVDGWLADSEQRERLLNDNFERVGVGIEVTRNNTAYATVNLCS